MSVTFHALPPSANSACSRCVLECAGIDFEAAQDPEALRLQLGIGEPNDVAHMVAFLASDEAKHINAAEFVVDNGMSSVVRT